MAKRETVGARIKRLRRERELSQRDLSSPGISYAYISRIEADARTPSVKALRKIANRLGATVEHLETGQPTPTELGVADAGVNFGELTKSEIQKIRTAAAEGAREAAQRATKQVLEDRKGSGTPNPAEPIGGAWLTRRGGPGEGPRRASAATA